jgi:hypothetical protein
MMHVHMSLSHTNGNHSYGLFSNLAVQCERVNMWSLALITSLNTTCQPSSSANRREDHPPGDSIFDELRSHFADASSSLSKYPMFKKINTESENTQAGVREDLFLNILGFRFRFFRIHSSLHAHQDLVQVFFYFFEEVVF